MLIRKVSQKYFNNALISIHTNRINSLFETVWALMNDAKLTLTSLGQHKNGSAGVKHKIKSVDRLLGNEKLHREIPAVYHKFFEAVVSCFQQLFIIVDWSGCCGDEWHMLRASVVHDGRSITIYNEIHPQNKLGNNEVHKQFLAALKRIIPADKKVIIITDSGFLTPWFSQVLKLGWDYIGRLPSYFMIKPDEEKAWIRVRDISCKKRDHIITLGKAALGKASKTPVNGNIYIFHGKYKNRREKSKFPDQNRRFQNQNKSPWVLATSLDRESHSGLFVINRYKSRMQIEQNFRDEKNPRFGFGWRLGRTKCAKRKAVLCLIAHIAEFFLLLIGTMAEKLNLHKSFQVNTRKERVLSLVTLAKQILKHPISSNLKEEYINSIGIFLNIMFEIALC